MDSRCLVVLLALGAAVHASRHGYQSGAYHPTPVHGRYSDWSEYSQCDVTCGKGMKTRTRKCDNPAPAYGGNDCYGPATQTVECDAGHCPVHGGYSAWSVYSVCDVTCGLGQKSRTRKCDSPAPAYGGNNCYGPSIEYDQCYAGHCPVHGGWTVWGDYSECSVKCGHGVQTRQRSCTNPAPAYGGDECSGDDEETKPCYSGYRCPVHGGYGDWSSWSKCSKTCGGGKQTRQRSCDSPAPGYGGNPCYGDSDETRHCNTHDCPRSHYPY